MRKTLSLVRHAKSSWDAPNLEDHLRPLNPRGQRDAPLMGTRMADRKLHPSLIISSDAERAISTARIIAAKLRYAADNIVTDDDLYLASPATILRVLAARAGQHSNVILVGHNPGITSLANSLSNARIDNMPTCAAFCVEFDIDDWRELPAQTGTLAWFDFPKNTLSAAH